MNKQLSCMRSAWNGNINILRCKVSFSLKRIKQGIKRSSIRWSRIIRRKSSEFEFWRGRSISWRLRWGKCRKCWSRRIRISLRLRRCCERREWRGWNKLRFRQIRIKMWIRLRRKLKRIFRRRCLWFLRIRSLIGSWWLKRRNEKLERWNDSKRKKKRRWGSCWMFPERKIFKFDSSQKQCSKQGKA